MGNKINETASNLFFSAATTTTILGATAHIIIFLLASSILLLVLSIKDDMILYVDNARKLSYFFTFFSTSQTQERSSASNCSLFNR